MTIETPISKVLTDQLLSRLIHPSVFEIAGIPFPLQSPDITDHGDWTSTN